MNIKALVAALGAGLVIAVSAPASATVIYTVAGGEADFTFGSNTLTVVLIDTTVNPGGVIDNLSGLQFSFAGGTGAALTGAVATHSRTVFADGTYSDAPGFNTVATVGWEFLTAPIYQVDVLCGGCAGPSHTILGQPDGSNLYSNANSSIAGNGPHNPFIQDRITFTFTFASGVNSNTQLSAVNFQFGTTPDTFIPGTSCTTNCGDIPLPEPAPLALLAIGMLALLGTRSAQRQVR
jgi:hypothetical protein